MTTDLEDSSSTPHKLALLILIVAIIIGNICVFVTYFVRARGKHCSHTFILSLAFIDLFIGSFVLPLRFISSYGSPLNFSLCAALSIGESSAFASIIYTITTMIFIRVYELRLKRKIIQRRYLLILLIIFWMIFFLFYTIPFMINNSNYLLAITTKNITTYCTGYTTGSLSHPLWMSYTELVVIYSCPLLSILLGLGFLSNSLCQAKPRRIDFCQRKQYLEQRQMTWHVIILTITFVVLWVPWISIRILIIFSMTSDIFYALQVTYYLLIVRSVFFPILYASTNRSFRGSFAIYKHKRVTMNNRVWPVNERVGY